MDVDEEDTFVSLGTPLEIFEDDEARKKPVSVHDLPAKDSRGRQRFHGAFTGGFSAGFFHTVGSKEGFQPSTFVSSRSTKEKKVYQQPEDFMDDEDLGEHGIAPRKLVTSSTYSSEERGQKRKALTMASVGSGSIPEAAHALMNLIVPARQPVGVLLLRKMGWKDGQGIGPRERIRRKLKNKKRGTNPSSERVIGCALPPSDSSSSDNEELAMSLDNLTFAPRDRNPVVLKAKDNVHGIGYSGLDPRTALFGPVLDPPPSTQSGFGRRGIRGQGFGVGALEEDDDDIYHTDSMSNYDMTMQLDDGEGNFGWTAPGHHKKQSKVPIGYVGKLPEGFKLSSKLLRPKKVFKPPSLPQGFRPTHHFSHPCEATGDVHHNTLSRTLVLGEKPIFSSAPVPVAPTPISSQHTTQVDTQRETSQNLPQSRNMPPSQNLPLSSGMNTPKQAPVHPVQTGFSFKPFAKDPAKQERYEKYLKNIANKDSSETSEDTSVTEWEREHEKEEFARAAKLYKPLSSMMAFRFTNAKYADDLDSASLPPTEVSLSEEAKAAQMKMYGQLTRQSHEWHPDKLLCRRFNVPHPYPGSTIVGLLSKPKRDPHSVFNLLEFPASAPPSQPAISQTPREIMETPTSDTKTIADKTPHAPVSLPKTSFAIKQRPTASSIFSVLYEEKDDREKHKEAEKIEQAIEELGQFESKSSEIKEKDNTDSLDLFKAIFNDSDSNEEEEEELVEEKDEAVEKEADIDILENRTVAVSSISKEIVLSSASSSEPHSPQAKEEEEASESYGPALPPSIPPSFLASVSHTRQDSKLDVDDGAHKSKKNKKSSKHKKEKKAKKKKSKHKKKDGKRKREGRSDDD